MIGILILSHGGFGECLIQAAAHMLGDKPQRLRALGFTRQVDLELLGTLAHEALAEVDDGTGVLILTDMYGATPANLAARLAIAGKIEVLAGVNMPMLLRALTYRQENLANCVAKAEEGGIRGIVPVLHRDFT